MVKIGLQIKAYFQNVEYLTTVEDCTYLFKLRCNSCGEVSDKWQEISSTNEVETVRSTTNYLAKCKLCSRENSMDVLTDTLNKYVADDEGNFKSLIAFDCRGVEPTEFKPEEGWEAKAQSGKVFNDIDLTEGLWADYDDKANESVEINEFEWKFVKLK